MFLEARNPFDDSAALRSIASGEIADKTVNVDIVKEVGKHSEINGR